MDSSHDQTDLSQTTARLDLIQIASVAALHSPVKEVTILLEMIEALCRHRDVPVDVCFSPERREALDNLASDWFAGWRAKYESEPS